MFLSVKGLWSIQGWTAISCVFQERILRSRKKYHQREQKICWGKKVFYDKEWLWADICDQEVVAFQGMGKKLAIIFKYFSGSKLIG